MIEPISPVEINNQLSETSNVVIRYMNQIKSQPDDFAHKHLEELQQSLKKSSEALVKYEFKKEHTPLAYDETLGVLEEAIYFLTQKKILKRSRQKIRKP
ncbi:MAG: hypothetical protein HWD61_02585 [Parachlamydiaceae bacterium]|nr:MAG: hypothetical protein HWD61_02585 [Parachlamydiaceae bacterium]